MRMATMKQTILFRTIMVMSSADKGLETIVFQALVWTHEDLNWIIGK